MIAIARKPRTLRHQLAKKILMVMVLTWMLGASIAIVMSKRETDALLDSALQEVAQRILPLAFADLLDPSGNSQKLNKIDAMPPVGHHKERITYVVSNSKGQIQLQSHDADLSMFPENPQAGFSDGRSGRLYTEFGAQGSIRVTVAEMPGIRSAALWANIGALLIPLVLALIGSLILIHLAIASVLKPLDKFRQAIDARNEDDLEPVEIIDLPSELNESARAVNDLMQRLHVSLDAERQFVARAAHELKTPIAAALAQTQLLAKQTSDDAVSDRVKAVEKSLKRLSNLSSKMLEAAKSEGSHVFAEHPINLSTIVDFVTDELVPRTETNRVAIDAPDRVMSLVDADAAAIVMRNLIENALKYGDPQKPITVRLTEKGIFTVANDGPIIPDDTRQRLLRPFQRGDATTEGTGLGLSIVANYAKAFGSQLEIISPAPSLGSGCKMKIIFPIVQ